MLAALVRRLLRRPDYSKLPPAKLIDTYRPHWSVTDSRTNPPPITPERLGMRVCHDVIDFD